MQFIIKPNLKDSLKTFTKSTFHETCRQLAKHHLSIKKILDLYGLPTMYQRPFTFEALVHIMLEQQVSLASARAALIRLQTKLGIITPAALLQLNTEELRACSVSRQKAGYLHHLSKMVAEGDLLLEKLENKPDDVIRLQLQQVKGIGPWTADVVLMLCLQRSDVFPVGDIALVNSVRHIHEKPDWKVEEIGNYATCYAPYRSVAAFCYWHAYIKRKNISVIV